MAETEKRFIVADCDYDRVGRSYASKAEAIEYARNNVQGICGQKAYVFEAVSIVTPAPQPASIVDL